MHGWEWRTKRTRIFQHIMSPVGVLEDIDRHACVGDQLHDLHQRAMQSFEEILPGAVLLDAIALLKSFHPFSISNVPPIRMPIVCPIPSWSNVGVYVQVVIASVSDMPWPVDNITSNSALYDLTYLFTSQNST